MTKIEFDDYLGVVNLLQDYADALDRGDIDALLAQFTPDAHWDFSPSQQRRGHDEIRAFFAERFREFGRTHHIVGPPRLTPQADGTLRSVAYVYASHRLADGSPYTQRGRYVDVLRKVDGAWRIARRSVVVHLMEGSTREFTYLGRRNDD